jgi:uncharacterized membrane protein YtjA (UPF0391 family)
VAENVIGVSFAIVGFAGSTATEARLDKSTFNIGVVCVVVDTPANEAFTSNMVPTLVPMASPL